MPHLLSTELRHIEASHLRKLSAIIDQDRNWLRLIEELTRPVIITSDRDTIAGLKLTPDAINLIEQQFRCGESPTLALLNHWAITGRRRPTIGILRKYLLICGLRWAEDYLCKEVLNIEPPETVIQSSSGRTATEVSSRQIDDEFKFKNLNELVDVLESCCPRFSFDSIYESTNGFCHQPYDSIQQTGVKIGEGRFSSVYRAQTQIVSSNPNTQRQVVAAKLLKSECNEKFLVNEINIIKRVKHDNILELLGISLGESQPGLYAYICLVYPYMQNGSLFDCLQRGSPTIAMQYLAWEKRLDIALKVARGIVYLHSFSESPIIHRDIKTANIFIDVDLEPKVGDFTLVRQLDIINTGETQYSQNVMGTSVYMPPEAFRGDMSTKFDTFSFGIVLLELLTGKKPFDEKHNEDLFTYINEQLSDIEDNSAPATDSRFIMEERDRFLAGILDPHAGDWNFEYSKSIFELALKATESRKRDRPEMSFVLGELKDLCALVLKDDDK